MRECDRLFIGGEWVESNSNRRFQVLSPADEQVIGALPLADSVDVDAAVAAARHAFDHGPWPGCGVEERIAVLRAVRDMIADRAEAFASLITDEMGSPITQSREIQLTAPLRLIEDYLALASSYSFSDLRSAASGRALVLREPIGVVAAVVPWNTPLMSPLMKVVPAFLAGCTVVLKPDPQTALTSLALARLFEEAGLPPGVLNVVPAEIEASEHLVSHSGVDKVSFTGSSAAGRRIAGICGGHLRKVTLELGGKSAGIILDDADLAETLSALRLGALRNSGQVCTLKTRLLVSRRRHDEFVSAFVDMVGSMKIGDPRDPTTQIGPMVSSRQRDTVQGYIDIGKEQGARVAFGGEPIAHERGWYVPSTVFTEVDPSMRIAQEEIFGPVIAILAYEDEDEAVSIANNSDYGLSGAVYSSDVERGLAVAKRIRSGVVEVNGSPAGFHAPFGGLKASGMGSEGGVEGLEEYLQPKAIGLPSALWAALDEQGRG